MNSEREQGIRLADGRQLGYAACGAPGGTPLLYFHGIPGSRLELLLPGVEAALAEHGVRAVAIDRPGMGLSTFRPRRSILDTAGDARELADQLGLGSVLVVGASGGAPYALAFAHRYPERTAAICLVGALAPPGRAGWAGQRPASRCVLGLARWASPSIRWLARRASRFVEHDPDRFVDEVVGRLAEVDQAALREAGMHDALLQSWREAFRAGPDGPWWDVVLAARRWGFRLADVPLPVTLWIGGRDETVPPAMSRRLAAGLSRAEIRLHPNEGHFSLILNRVRDIVGLLVSRGRSARGPSAA